MLNSITFAGKNSADYGLGIEKFPSFVKPKRKYTKYSVAGRNGDLYMMQDAYENVSQEYEVWSKKGQWTDIIEWLYEDGDLTIEELLNLETNGYHQLKDTYDPDTIRVATFIEETEVENIRNRYGRATITFDCRPERFTADAFDWIDISEEQTTKSGDIVTFDPSVIIEAGQGKNKADVADTTVTDSRYFANLTDLTPSGTYTISFDYVRTGEVTIVITTSTFNYFPLTATSGRFSGTVTATAMGAISVGCHEITGSLSVSNFQCEEGTEATEYEPYELVADLDTAPYVQSLTAEINAVQSGSGDPSPTNIRPISGYSSVNVVDSSDDNLLRNAVWTDGYRFNSAGNLLATDGYSASDWIAVQGGATINLNYSMSTYVCICEYSANNFNTFITRTTSGTSVTLASNTTYIRVSIATDKKTFACATYGTVTTTTISLGSTIYGGTLDVTNGVLTVDKGYVDLGSLDWAYNGSAFDNMREFSVVLTGKANGILNMMCSALTVKSASGASGYKCIRGRAANATISVVWDDMTVADFKTAVSGYQLVYDLATSQTVTLTPTQVQTVLGQNNIWADSGTVEVVINKPILNETARTAKPCLKVYGSGAGTVYCNGTTITISDIPQYIYIDSDSQNCFKEISDANLNSLVSLSNGFPVLSAGDNSISWSGGVTNVEVMPRWWNL